MKSDLLDAKFIFQEKNMMKDIFQWNMTKNIFV